MYHLVIGLAAHVDAGKTTLCEALLYACGTLRRQGRVDHGNAFLDTYPQEKQRGITIFSKQAVLSFEDLSITLLDTPGHSDFSSETERALRVMDCAVLVINGAEPLQPHTVALWNELRRLSVPVFLFLNKQDLPCPSPEAVMETLRERLSPGCVDFTHDSASLPERIALCSDALTEEYLQNEVLRESSVRSAFSNGLLFPVFFGSALKGEGIEPFLRGISSLISRRTPPAAFGARVYQIRYAGTERLTFCKVTGGILRAKDVLSNRSASVSPEALWEEKADSLRIYSGDRYTTVREVHAGELCAILGLTKTFPGQGLGTEPDEADCGSVPVLRYNLLLPPGTDSFRLYRQLLTLSEEDPQLSPSFVRSTGALQLCANGSVQKEILQDLIFNRFGVRVEFGPSTVLYRETLASPVIGTGHFEPLRHYAHVSLLLEPLPRGSGIEISSLCSEDRLKKNWQRLILSHIGEKQHAGVLTGAPLTDVRITLLDGKAHPKHTEGGDFREATYRAIRQGLMSGDCCLLEPVYRLFMELPSAVVGKIMTDLQQMNGDCRITRTDDAFSFIEGTVPVAAFSDYALRFLAITKGEGRLSLRFGGYIPCSDASAVIAVSGYQPEADTENPADSIYCSHGAGHAVHWSLMRNLSPDRADSPPAEPEPVKRGSADEDSVLTAIFEKTYGPVKNRAFLLNRRPSPVSSTDDMLAVADAGEEYLLVDGYNVLFSWEELNRQAKTDIGAAREQLIRLLIDHHTQHPCNLILVFDAYKVSGGEEQVEDRNGIYIVYTRESEIADVYIEKVTKVLQSDQRQVRVVTSDALEQLIILGRGALRVPSSVFREEVLQSEAVLQDILKRNHGEERGSYRIWETANGNNL